MSGTEAVTAAGQSGKVDQSAAAEEVSPRARDTDLKVDHDVVCELMGSHVRFLWPILNRLPIGRAKIPDDFRISWDL